ncbi:hypothetical protein [Streptomyces sp. NPDC047042]|uniref:hypothetical protein n=1 Tax=Streptomyces sp. NPDC047042 TaxID=3154807 RepID=UPI0033FCA409
MADDDRYGWLDRATAERLLSGESLEASLASAGPEARDQAERLAKTLDSLSVDSPPSGDELPGEAAALAAFRKARPVADLTAGAPVTNPGPDIGLVRVGGAGRFGASRRRGVRPARWGRPLRAGLGAALAAGMVGSVAMAAGVGVLPNPFRGGDPGRPAATVSAGESADSVPVSPSPDGGTRGRSVPSQGPDATTGGSGDQGSAGGGGAKIGPGDGKQGSRSDMSLPGDWRGGLASSCRDMRSGKKLEAERRRALEKAAKGAKKVPKYCEKTLNHEPAGHPNPNTGTGTGTGTGQGGGEVGAEGGQSGAGDSGGNGHGGAGNGQGNGDGHGGGNGQGNGHGGGGNGHGNGNGGGNGQGNGHGGRTVSAPAPAPTSFTAVGATTPRDEPAPAPGPSYGILPRPKTT